MTPETVESKLLMKLLHFCQVKWGEGNFLALPNEIIGYFSFWRGWEWIFQANICVKYTT